MCKQGLGRKGCLAFGFAQKDKMCWFKHVQKAHARSKRDLWPIDGTSLPTPGPKVPTPKPPTLPPTPNSTVRPQPWDGKPVQVFIMMGGWHRLDAEFDLCIYPTNRPVEHAG